MITAVTTCMGRLEHLKTTLPMMLDEFDHVIVVDWSCPQKSGEWASKQGAEVVFRHDEQYFNASKARNLGARHVKTRGICFIDADCLVMPGTGSEIASLLDLSSFVVAAKTHSLNDISGLFGFIALDIGNFWGVKGYNDELKGYAFEDCFLRAKLCLERGLKPQRLSIGALASIRHSDELRGKFHSEPAMVSAKRNKLLFSSYLAKFGISDWTLDPRTAESAYIPP